MSVRSTVLAASVLMLALVFAAGTPAKPPSSPGDKQSPTTPTNLRITASSRDEHLARLGRRDRQARATGGTACRTTAPAASGSTRRGRRSRCRTSCPTARRTWTVYAIDANGQPLGQQQRGDATRRRRTRRRRARRRCSRRRSSTRRGSRVSWTASTDNTTPGLVHALHRRASVRDSSGYIGFCRGRRSTSTPSADAHVPGHRARRATATSPRATS